MFSQYLTSLYRSLTRHRLYTALNLLGLAVGVAVFLTLSLYVAFETSFETWLPDARAIYVVRSSWNMPGQDSALGSYTMGGLVEQLKADYPQLVGARVWEQSGTVRQGGNVAHEQVEIADPNLIRVFDLPLVAGDRANLLRSPDEVLVSETTARRYFGAANPIGRRLTLALQGAVRDYRITGVLKDAPRNSDLTLGIVVPYTPQLSASTPYWSAWGNVTVRTYLRFDSPVAATALARDLDAFTDRHGAQDFGRPDTHNVYRLHLTPLLALHLADPKDATAVAAIGAVGLLTLLLAGVNYVNLATAQAGLRAKEVALRKVMGAARTTLVGQFLGEAIVTAAVATLIGLALCELALPALNAGGGLHLVIHYLGQGSVLPVLLGAVLVLGLGAGLYPALVLSGFQPASVLAAARTPGGGRAGGRVRQTLVLLQFAVAIAFTIGAVVIVSQANYLRHVDLGFDRSGLIVVKSFGDSELTSAQQSSILGLWRATPGVVSASIADIAAGDNSVTEASNFTRPGMKGTGPTLNRVNFGTDFARTYRVKPITGRLLDESHGLDDLSAAQPISVPQPQAGSTPPPHNVLININALKILGFASPQAALGQTIYAGAGSGAAPLQIVGVVGNIRFRSPRTAVPPTVYYLRIKDLQYPVVSVRYAGARPQVVLARLRAAWRQIAPEVPFSAQTGEDNLEAYYRSDDQRGRLFSWGAGLAVAIGCLGLYGLAAFTTARRTKEIGIRKTLGASTGDVLRLLLGQFLWPVLIANLIAWPVAYLVMGDWLSGFDQRIALSPLYFVGASALALVIAVVTVLAQALKVARAEPAAALRYE